jgi:hypothetical protein
LLGSEAPSGFRFHCDGYYIKPLQADRASRSASAPKTPESVSEEALAIDEFVNLRGEPGELQRYVGIHFGDGGFECRNQAGWLSCRGTNFEVGVPARFLFLRQSDVSGGAERVAKLGIFGIAHNSYDLAALDARIGSLEILTQRVFVATALKCSAAFILAFLHLTSAFGTIIIFSFTADRVTVAADSRRGRLRGSEIPSLDQQHRGTPTNAGTRRFPCAQFRRPVEPAAGPEHSIGLISRNSRVCQRLTGEDWD